MDWTTIPAELRKPLDLTGFRPAEPPDQPQPMLQWVDIDQLVIDRSYQRAITGPGRKAIQLIADNFDWRKFGAVMCAPAEGGRIAIVDGQHRAHAAALAGIARIPAVIVPMTLAEQARGFAAINRDRVGMDPHTIFRAELAAGAEWAVAADQAVRAAGCRMATSNPSFNSRKPGQIFAPALIRKMIRDGEGAAITAGLRAIRDSQGGDLVENYTGPVLKIWLPAIAANQQHLTIDLSAAFDEIDFNDVITTARAWSRGTGGSAVTYAIDAVRARLRDHLSRRAA